MLQACKSRELFPMKSIDLLIDVNLPAARRPRGRLSLYQKWVPRIFKGRKGWASRKADNLTIRRATRTHNISVQEPKYYTLIRF
jgi:hypothetical protein